MNRTILLVDDDVELVDLLRDYLNQEGFVVVTASSRLYLPVNNIFFADSNLLKRKVEVT